MRQRPSALTVTGLLVVTFLGCATVLGAQAPGTVARPQSQVQEANKRLVSRFFTDVVNAHSVERLNDLFSPDLVVHTMDGSDVKMMSGGIFASFLKDFFSALPDVSYAVDSILAEADMVAVNLTAHATHRGTFLGIPGTGKRLRFKEMWFYRVADGKIVEGWVTIDNDGIKTQLQKP
jgi:steroid delta-isomerase-like uncharacterized protein